MRKILFILIFYLFSFPVCAAEVITDFHADIHVQEDGSAIIKERITVNREGKQIKRGIYRDLPKTKNVRYSVISVKRDWKTEPYFTENVGRFFRINTGNDNFLPRNGLYTFEIAYRAENVILGFKDYDEIYWNVTGNGWAFPIEHASAKVFLPQGAKEIQRAGYIGPYGSKTSSDYNLKTGFFSAQHLKKGDGLTVAVGFDKGFVRQTKTPDVSLDQYLRYAVLIFAAYLLFTWFLFGRDPVKDAVMPRFNGLPDLTPAQAGWIYSYGHNKVACLAAALLQGGVSGFFKIEDKSGITVTKMREAKNGEEKLFDHNLHFPLFLTEKYSPTMERFTGLFEKFLKQKTGERYFTSNTLWVVLGAILMLALIAGLSFLVGLPQIVLIMGFYLIFFIPVGKMFLSAIVTGKIPFSSLFMLIFIGIHFSVMSLGISSDFPETRVIFLFYILSCVALVIYSYLIMGTSVLLGFVCVLSLFLVVFNILIFLNKSAFLSLEAKRGHFLF